MNKLINANNEMTFIELVNAIREVDEKFATHAIHAVNISLTLRNWVIGYYIAEFEFHGADRATYGDQLLTELSSELQNLGVSNTGRRQLYNYLSFYRAFPGIVRTVPAQFEKLLPGCQDHNGNVGMVDPQKESFFDTGTVKIKTAFQKKSQGAIQCVLN